MTTLFTLHDIAKPACPISSTVTISFSIAGDQINSFSAPPILYYAMKAKTLASLGVDNEVDAIKENHLDIRTATLSDMREIAKSVHRELTQKGISMPNLVSAAIQDRILYRLLNESEAPLDTFPTDESVPINASRAKKNITIPTYLFNRWEAVLGSEKAVRLAIHEITANIREILYSAGLLDSKNKPIKDAANSSFSRKVHNVLLLDLLELSNIPELKMSPSMLDVKMQREPKLETKVRNKKLAVPVG